MFKLVLRGIMLIWMCSLSLLVMVIGLGQQRNSGVVAYTSWRDSQRIYVMDVELRFQHPISAIKGIESFPAWSPDGTKIAFQRTESRIRLPFLVVVDFPAGDSLTFPYPITTVPVWSSDSSWVVVSGLIDNQSGVIAIEPDTGIVKHVANTMASHIDWSPDGNWLLFSTSEQVSLVNTDCLDTLTACQLKPVLLSNLFQPIYKPTWSPDGSHIAYVSQFEDAYQLQIRAIICEDLSQASCLGELVVFPVSFGDLFNLNWSPDSRKLVLAIQRNARTQLYIVEIESQKNYLTPIFGWGSDWSPDSEQIVFHRLVFTTPPRSNIAVFDIQSGAVYDLTQPILYDVDPVWRP